MGYGKTPNIIILLISVFTLYTTAWTQGLLGEYYNDIELKQLVLKRVDKRINLNGYNAGPAPGVPGENFSIRWTGEIFIPATDSYVFHITVDDGIRIWIDNTLIFDEWHEQEVKHFKKKVDLQGNQYHAIRIEYFNTIINSILNFWWESPEDAYTVFGYEVYRHQQSIPLAYFRPHSTEVPVSKTLKSDAVKPTPIVKLPLRKKHKNIDNALLKIDSLKQRNKPFVLNSILFSQSKPKLLPGSEEELDKLYIHMLRNPDLKIIIMGHTDYRGDSLDNNALSLLRANTVAAYIISKGISKTRVKTVGYGGARPIVHGTDRTMNRRVEVQFE